MPIRPTQIILHWFLQQLCLWLWLSSFHQNHRSIISTEWQPGHWPCLPDARPSLFLCAHFEKPQSSKIHPLVQGGWAAHCVTLCQQLPTYSSFPFSGKQRSSSDCYYYFMLASNTLWSLEGEFVTKFWWCLKKSSIRNAVELRYWGDSTLIWSLPFVPFCGRLLLSSLPLPTLLMFFSLEFKPLEWPAWLSLIWKFRFQHDSLIVQLRLDAHPGPNLKVGSGEEGSELGVLFLYSQDHHGMPLNLGGCDKMEEADGAVFSKEGCSADHPLKLFICFEWGWAQMEFLKTSILVSQADGGN